MSDRFRFRCFGNENALFLQGMHKVNSFEIHEGGETASIYYDNGSYDGCVWLCNVSIIQSTGLKDSTGKLIFEGDIVEHNGTNKVAKQKPLVFITFKDGCFCLTAPMKACESIENISNGESMDNSASIRCAIFEAWSNDCELKLKIIGNIYENPELMEANE